LVAHDRSIAAKSSSELCGVSAEVRVETALSGPPMERAGADAVE
jgi:hypothetical protein